MSAPRQAAKIAAVVLLPTVVTLVVLDWMIGKIARQIDTAYDSVVNAVVEEAESYLRAAAGPYDWERDGT